MIYKFFVGWHADIKQDKYFKIALMKIWAYESKAA